MPSPHYHIFNLPQVRLLEVRTNLRLQAKYKTHMLLELFISPQVPVSDPRHSDMDGALGHLVLGQKIAESNTWTHTRVRTWVPKSEQHSKTHNFNCKTPKAYIERRIHRLQQEVKV